jgi:hypothetical protein
MSPKRDLILPIRCRCPRIRSLLAVVLPVWSNWGACNADHAVSCARGIWSDSAVARLRAVAGPDPPIGRERSCLAMPMRKCPNVIR